MRVYLCGLLDVAEPSREFAFLQAADELKARGHVPMSPYTSGLDCPDMTLDQALDADRAALAGADAVAVLGKPGVSCYETVVAEMSGKPVVGITEMVRVAG